VQDLGPTVVVDGCLICSGWALMKLLPKPLKWHTTAAPLLARLKLW